MRVGNGILGYEVVLVWCIYMCWPSCEGWGGGGGCLIGFVKYMIGIIGSQSGGFYEERALLGCD